MDKPLQVSQIIGPLEGVAANLIPGFKTSEGRLTAIAGAAYALAQTAEGLGLLNPGTAGGLWPAAAMVGVYALGRTLLKAKAQQPPPQPAAPDPLAAMVAQAIKDAQAQAKEQMLAKLKAALGPQ